MRLGLVLKFTIIIEFDNHELFCLWFFIMQKVDNPINWGYVFLSNNPKKMLQIYYLIRTRNIYSNQITLKQQVTRHI